MQKHLFIGIMLHQLPMIGKVMLTYSFT